MGKKRRAAPLEDCTAHQAGNEARSSKSAKANGQLLAAEKAAKSGKAAKQPAAKAFIDDLFASSKKAKEAAKHDVESVQHEPVSKQKASSAKGTKDDLFGAEEQARHKTAEGYSIYSEEELGMLKRGGESDLCPFDCDCCY